MATCLHVNRCTAVRNAGAKVWYQTLPRSPIANSTLKKQPHEAKRSGFISRILITTTATTRHPGAFIPGRATFYPQALDPEAKLHSVLRIPSPSSRHAVDTLLEARQSTF